MNYLHQLKTFLLNSHIFIGLCALAQCMLTYHLSGIDPDPALLLFIFSATVVIYGIPLMYFRLRGFALNFSESQQWVDKRFVMFSGIFSCCFLMMAVSALYLPVRTLAWLSVLGAFALAYELPILSTGVKKIRLRDFGIAKMLVVSGVWLIVIVWIPVINEGADLTDYFWMNNRFIFILSNAMMFDMRDMEKDTRNGHSTVPLKIGYDNSKAAAIGLLFLNAGLIMWNPIYRYNDYFIPLILAILLNILLIFRINKNTHSNFYTFYVDGMLIMQFLLVYAFTYLHRVL